MKRLAILLLLLLLLLAPLVSKPVRAFDCLSDCDWYAGGVATGCAIAGGDPWTCYLAGELAACQCRSRCDAALPQCGGRAFVQAAWQRYLRENVKHWRLEY